MFPSSNMCPLIPPAPLTSDYSAIVQKSVISNSYDNFAIRILAMQHDYPLVGGDKSVGQNLGKMFERLTAEFLRATFLRMQDLRPGAWTVQLLGNSGRSALCNFAQYEHLAYIKEVTSKDPKLAAALGVDYVVSPDIVIYREPESDAVLCAKLGLVDNSVGLLSSFRNQRGDRRPCLHASVSAKFTIRSDRAQNSRTEALNLIRNRKGHLPQIVVVTAEPLPSRIASIAQGVGDIDCVYHFALYELIEAVNQSGSSNSAQVLDMLVSGNRLRDISDLPLDLAV